VQVRICFDGPSASVDRIANNLHVEFSGGEGEHRADRIIAAHLDLKNFAELGAKRFIVTDDRALRGEILGRGAKFVPVNVFAILLQDFKCLD
jgi:hypothetical protein